MNQADKDFLVKTLVDQAVTSGEPAEFFKDLAKRAEFPDRWYPSFYGQLKANPAFTARNVVDWAGARDINIEKPSFTTLGSLLRPLFQDLGLDTARRVAVIIVSNRLILDNEQLVQLMKDYGIPFPAIGTAGNVEDISIPLGPVAADRVTKVGPEMDWRGPDEVDLQAFSWSQPDFMDGGFLMRATDRALSVCHVSIPQKGSGTGFLIRPDLLITNYHVLENPEIPGDDKSVNAPNVVLRFGYTTTEEGGEEEGREFKLAPNQPIVDYSPVAELDFILLRVEEGIKKVEGIKPVTYKENTQRDKSLNIIQHPHGGPLMFAFSSNGVTGVYDDGRIQYVSKAAGGSSGSPCFDDKWNLVAIHHAERSTWSGVKREGIRFDHIFQKIKDKIIN